MLISVNWLKKYTPDLDVSNVGSFKHRVDTRLSEVEDVSVKGEGLQNLVIAEIVSFEEHPTNKKLTVCQVSDGQGIHTVVCGAPNVRAGLKTIYCRPGGKVWNVAANEYMDIGARQMGEVKSEGMLCAPDEIELSNDHSKIIELPESIPNGTSATEMLQDTVIEIENKALPHRPDAFSHRGIAREMHAIFKTSWQDEPAKTDWTITADDSLSLSVDVQDKENCTRFTAVIISGVNVGPSPLWLQIALSRCGIRPINNVVDITNYVMLDIGQPLHAFDYAKVGGEIIVRGAKQNEKLTTLDGKERELEAGIAVVANPAGAQSVAGIMGGAATEIGDDTTTIILEAAGWEMYQIRRASRKLGLRSEASLRYEKGITNQDTLAAVTAAAQMIKDIAGGEVASEVVDIVTQPEPEVKIKLDLGQVKKFLGTDIDKPALVDILENLNLAADFTKVAVESMVRSDVTTELEITVPYYRRDLKITQDLLEEIGRLHGYENIALTLPKRDLQPPARNRDWERKKDIKRALAAAGATEVYTYSMVGPELYRTLSLPFDQLIHIPNPVSPELGLVRDQILPSLVTKLKQNLQKYDSFSLFEVGRIATWDEKDGELPSQPHHLAIAAVAETDAAALAQLQNLVTHLNRYALFGGVKVKDQAGTKPAYLHPGAWGRVDVNNADVGYLGILHPLAIEELNLTGSGIAVLEISLDRIFAIQTEAKSNYKGISNFQAVKRDLSLWESENTSLGTLFEAIATSAPTEVEEYFLLDQYLDKDSGKHSFTLRLIIQSDNRTLNTEDINAVIEQVQAIATKLGFQSR
jgi:phenylalanyl-tRNA synthetase beta chain